jgi:hypothetical protein
MAKPGVGEIEMKRSVIIGVGEYVASRVRQVLTELDASLEATQPPSC